MSKFYGQPWISDNQLLQEVITFKPGADAESNVEVLIDNHVSTMDIRIVQTILHVVWSTKLIILRRNEA